MGGAGHIACSYPHAQLLPNVRSHGPCAERRLGRPLSFDPSSEAAAHTHMQLPTDDSAAEGYMGAAYGSNGAGGDLEMSGLVLKTFAPEDGRHA